MRKITIIVWLILIFSNCYRYNSRFKGFTIIEKFHPTRLIEIKINAPYDQEIVSIFNKMKRNDQQVTLYFDRNSLLGYENQNMAILDSKVELNNERITYYQIDVYKIVGYEFLLELLSYRKVINFISLFSLGIIPIEEKFDVTFILSASNSIYESKSRIANTEASFHTHTGIDYINNYDFYDNSKDGILQAYEFLARYILY
ncbi:hypothetical protein NUH30_19035 [Leptospira sp. 85282-16]|uniref:hypothetical protein n=1 Tax=Leptospira sp. 85282-16 TaxID=2971256 RepID=UPI0021C24FFA|nr:hypothetical protein [Leptospira sp. 85282-16]MCT8335789.1 hypothetical protein [Leptospira sp. 85282-16]